MCGVIHEVWLVIGICVIKTDRGVCIIKFMLGYIHRVWVKVRVRVRNR